MGANYVPIILGRAFLPTSNAIINRRNGVMQLTFGYMTLEFNIFHLSKKHIHVVEEGPEEVCLIDTILEEQAEQQQLQDVLINELADFHEELQEAKSYVLYMGHGEKKNKFCPC